MSPLELPINSISWLAGSMACLALGLKSLFAYRESFSQLAKYICYFGFTMGFALLFFAISPLFTQSPETLRYPWIAGEFFVYASMVPQAAILWSLILRSKVSINFITVPVALIGLASWANAIPTHYVYVTENFIGASESGLSTFTLAMLLGGLFIPVGVHFMRATMRQTETKERLNTFVLGLVYIGIGVSTSSHLLLVGEVATVISSIGNLAFFAVLFGVIAWPREVRSRSPLPSYSRASS